MIVLDTNVLSELMRPAPAPTVIAWLDAASSGELIATTAITVAEILYGIERFPDGRRGFSLSAAGAGTLVAGAPPGIRARSRARAGRRRRPAPRRMRRGESRAC